MHVPATIDDLTPQWLTDALRESAVLPQGASVASIDVERFGEGVGFVGMMARLRPRYDGDAPEAPASLIAKLASLDPGPRALSNMFGLYERETRFYNELAPHVSLHTPRSYCAAFDAPSGNCVLLLEDLSLTGRMGDQLVTPTAAEAELIIDELARMHAQWWNSPRFAEFEWLKPPSEMAQMGLQMMYPAVLPVFLERYGDRIAPALKAALPRLNQYALTAIAEAENGPMTLVHGDFRLDNMFFGNEGAPYRLALVDWQSPARSPAFTDWAYFITCSLSTDVRREREQEYLRRYHDRLVEGGVRDFTFDALMEDYRRMPLAMLAVGVITGATLEPTNERAVKLFDAIFDRFLTAADDLESVTFLS